MSGSTMRRSAIVGIAGLAAGAALAAPVAAGGFQPAAQHGAVKHVLLLSVDGLHQSDLAWYVARHPGSALAQLVGNGVSYRNARTTFPSDSFPGMIGQLTGGTPAATGIYYDDTYNHALLPAGTTNCAGAAPGTEVDLTEDLDKNKASIDAGQGLSGLPNNVLNMTGTPQTLIDPANLPVDPATCKPVYPNQYLKVNTVFEVAHQAGLRTAWSDKHPAYAILDGPSGSGIDDLFAPEINSAVPGGPAGSDWTTDNAYTRQYDSYKVSAVLHEIDGLDHSGTHRVGTPAVFGMNFQTVSTAQKLPTSDGLTGGYLPGGSTPGPLLSGALDYLDNQVGAMLQEIRKEHLADSTTVILSAKHGQSPTDPNALTRIPDGPILDALNAAWQAAHPGAGKLVVQSTDDDGMLLWLSDRSPAATSFAKNFLAGYAGTGNDVHGNPKPYTSSGLTTVYAGAAAAALIGVPPADPRVPDIIGVAQHGVVFTGGQGKIAEHGGDDPQDRDVPLVVGAAVPSTAFAHGRVVTDQVQTVQIAPTILALLGLDPQALQAVRMQHTAVLPAL